MERGHGARDPDSMRGNAAARSRRRIYRNSRAGAAAPQLKLRKKPPHKLRRNPVPDLQPPSVRRVRAPNSASAPVTSSRECSSMLRPKPRYMQPPGLNSMLKYRRSPADGRRKTPGSCPDTACPAARAPRRGCRAPPREAAGAAPPPSSTAAPMRAPRSSPSTADSRSPPTARRSNPARRSHVALYKYSHHTSAPRAQT